MGQRSESPIFIGGFFKSGTSLLRAMLGQHSAIASGLESYWFDLDWHGPRDKKFHDHIERFRLFYELDEDSVQSITAESSSPLQFLDRFMSLYAARIEKCRWAEKTPGNILHLPEIFSEFPHAKVIHIVRDPKDVFASLRQAGKWDSVPVFAEMWSNMLGTVQQSEEKLFLSSSNLMTVRYENLIQYPVHTMRDVLDFVGEEWEEGVASFSGRKGEYEKVRALTGKASTTLDRLSKPLTKDRIGIWQNIVDSAEIESIRREVDRYGVLALFLKIEKETPSYPAVVN